MSAPGSPPTILLFRQDLRLADNPALRAAMALGAPVVPVFIFDPDCEWPPGGASRWWLHHSLERLQGALSAIGSRLVLRRGDTAATLDALIAETGAGSVLWNRVYEPAAIQRDMAIKAALGSQGVRAHSYNSALLVEPGELVTGAGKPYRVYTPFWRSCRARAPFGVPEPAPQSLPPPSAWPEGLPLAALELLPHEPDWSGGLSARWTPGEAGAQAQLDSFIGGGLETYKTRRDRPDIGGTASLSPYLHWGEIGPRQVWRAVEDRIGSGDLSGSDSQAETFLKELVWREFSYHLLFHFPSLPTVPLNERFQAFPWERDVETPLRAWQRGQTGYPIVDAGMRQLWRTGWMHNRVRMVVASFLTKHLLVPWQEGAAWFWDTLVDADLASNSASWQWVAGCGADAAPYFRIFNPVLQGQKFDPLGSYVRRWVPELERLADKHIHRPWEATGTELASAGIRLGVDYPAPIIDHRLARRRALEAYGRLKTEESDVTAHQNSSELAL